MNGVGIDCRVVYNSSLDVVVSAIGVSSVQTLAWLVYVKRCRCCGVGIVCGVVYVSGVDFVMSASGESAE